ncbi:MAG: DNA-3-methyladenine glycosylase family protein [Flavobacteriales bacterium]|jgi:DNA-3-methyladenine glycosylase II
MSAEAVRHLAKDAKLRPALEHIQLEKLRREENILLYLCLSIISQQLSTKVARVICDRFLGLFEGQEITERLILSVDPQELRAVGLSGAKVNYIRNVCEFFHERKLHDEQLHRLSDDEVIELLIEIKGVGRWTVEMLLMFAMAREDVFAVDDLGIRQAMIKLYQLKSENKKELSQAMKTISEQWKPYRSYACLALWNYKDS